MSLRSGAERHWRPAEGSLWAIGATRYRMVAVSGGECDGAVPPAFGWKLFEGNVPARILEWLGEDRELMAELQGLLSEDPAGGSVLRELVHGRQSKRSLEASAPSGQGQSSPGAHLTGRRDVASPAPLVDEPPRDAAKSESRHSLGAIFLEDVSPEPPALAAQFLAWLRQGIDAKAFQTNQPGGLVFMVTDGLLLVSPGIFWRFAQQRSDGRTPVPDAARRVQRELLRAGWHLRADDGVNMIAYERVQPHGQRLRIHGVVIVRPERFLPYLPQVAAEWVRVRSGPDRTSL